MRKNNNDIYKGLIKTTMRIVIRNMMIRNKIQRQADSYREIIHSTINCNDRKWKVPVYEDVNIGQHVIPNDKLGMQ